MSISLNSNWSFFAFEPIKGSKKRIIKNLKKIEKFFQIKISNYEIINAAVSDYYTLCTGGSGQSQTQLPNTEAINQATIKPDRNIPDPEPTKIMAEPTKNTSDVNLQESSVTEVNVEPALDMF